MNPTRFDRLIMPIVEALPATMGFTAHGSGEESDFVRFNHAKVRQSGSVKQTFLTVRVIDGRRHASAEIGLSGVEALDTARLRELVTQLAQTVPHLPEDPHLLLADTVENTAQTDSTPIPDALAITQAICAAAAGTDFVGIYAAGRQWRAFANHQGQRNWFESTSFLLDYSLVHSKDKAVKSSIGGKLWRDQDLLDSLALAKTQLAALDRPAHKIPPGSYRAYLTPAAVAEIMELVAHGNFGAQSQRRKGSVLNKLIDGDAQLDPRIHWSDETGRGLGPCFSSDGFVMPERVSLVHEGKHAGALTSPRTAAEYSVAHTGAGPWESPEALTMAGGELAAEDALAALGTGVWVSNLWYLNHSDRNAARFTGMTRFATFWVEDGKIVGPLDVMRFDASLYDLFGKDLEALTRSTQLMPSASTYEARSTAFLDVPGALVNALPFTL